MATIQMSQIRTDRIKNLRDDISGEEVKDLMNSISEHGLLYPIIVSGPDEESKYDLICGHRRYEAARRLDMKRINAAVRKVKTKDITALQLIENVQRKQLSPVEEARAYNTLVNEHKLSRADIAAQIGKTRAYVSNLMKVLEAHPEVQEALEEGEIGVSDVRDLRKLPQEDQQEIIQDARREAGMPPVRPMKPKEDKGKKKKKKNTVVTKEKNKEEEEAKKVLRESVKDAVDTKRGKKKTSKKASAKTLQTRLDSMKDEYAERFASRHDLPELDESQKGFFTDVMQFLFDEKVLIIR